MPKLHKYKNGSGYYIKATFPGKDLPKGKRIIVTYRVTPAGEEYLKHQGCLRRRLDDGSEISYEQLRSMYRRGYLTTDGTGAGLIEHIPKKKKRQSGCSCLGALLALPVALLMFACMYQLPIRTGKLSLPKPVRWSV